MMIVRSWKAGDSFISIDPGYEHFAWAKWVPHKNNNGLYDCGVTRWEDFDKMPRILTQNFDYLVIEKMVIYPGVKAEDPNDLLLVERTAGKIASWFPKSHWVEARKWKGQVSKKITAGRVIKYFGSDPCSHLAKEDSKHIYDALGIGGWWQGWYQ